MFSKVVSQVLLCLGYLFILSDRSTAARDNRPCREKIQGPFHDDHFNETRKVLPLPANQNNSVIVRCRVICQEDGASYTPQLRIVTTEDGQLYEKNKDWEEARDSELFEVVIPYSDNMFRCHSANNAINYEFQVTLNSPKANRSIAMCALFYQSVSESRFTEYCYTDRVAWLTIPDETSATPPPPAADATNASPTNSSFKIMETEERNSSFYVETSHIPPTTAMEPDIGYNIIQIPGEATIVVIIIATIVTIVALVLLVFLIILCKRYRQKVLRIGVENKDHS